ncbi:hypothetical protein CDG76_14265 [Nostoc sp. 'Peltigera membranacea cyanobiont' 210A]|uniref:hypothetical protein n=1 Tax=Nostoc sp. 'Peltigera membranacea cyanobiont' 210A TaxID=2014529 RepID=UPI000B9504D0|nr:hypothetical protein [Nostoc sp. 'Peltigera membranacea cyanobiont' 210A]OYD94567.1 hypothetical protein CDG76_14265 [Nostoc sp. 'Peltigera membranacea cyanobiont' 210A]
MNLLFRSTNIDKPNKSSQLSLKSSNPFIQLIFNRDTISETRKLLDRAIVSAAKDTLPNCKPPALTPSHWIWQLAASYHLTHHTALLMEEASGRFAGLGRWSLAQWAAQKAREEQGHDRLALLDIQSMGYEAEAVVKALLPPTAMALLSYFTQSVQAADPIGCVGYCYTMERLAMNIKAEHIQQVEAILPPNTYATRCLRMHSCLGSDVKHVDETVKIVAALSSEERTNITVACYETALLYFSSLKEKYISEVELQQVLNQLKLDPCSTNNSLPQYIC